MNKRRRGLRFIGTNTRLSLYGKPIINGVHLEVCLWNLNSYI